MKITLLVSFILIASLSFSQGSNQKYNVMDWLPSLVALLVCGTTVVANFLLNKYLRNSTERNLKTQLKSANNKALMEFRAKVSVENRQVWLNDLRDNVGEFIAKSGTVAVSVQFNEDQIETVRKDIELMHSYRAKIELLLNHKKEDQKALVDKVRQVAHMAVDVHDLTIMQAFNTERDELVDIARNVLKKHWDLIKNLVDTKEMEGLNDSAKLAVS